MGKKDYKKGMADAMEAYKGFGEKQEAAIRHVGQEVEKTARKVDKLGRKIGEITGYITDQEKAALYKLNTPVDIADLEDAEKRILLAVLYQLAADENEVTEEQQNYVRAVQQYLKIYNPQTEIDLDAVENIEDISAQKAVLQASLEFFRLGIHPEELTDEQEDFLDCFQVNRRTRKEIDGYINAIVEAVGIQGLSEKYGFVAAQPRSEFAKYKDNGPIPEKAADLCVKKLMEERLWRFQNDAVFLETQDYLVYFRRKGSCADPTNEDEGFFCIEKQTGKIERIDMDYNKEFHFDFVSYLEFHIWKNTIYFAQGKGSGIGAGGPLVAIDFATKKYQVLPFTIPSNDVLRVHLSGDDRYLMIHLYLLDGNYKFRTTKTYVMDRSQDNRTFVLEPDLGRIYDALIWDQKFILLGSKEKIGTSSLYEYDIKNHRVAELVHPSSDESSFYFNLGTVFTGLLGSSALRSQQFISIKKMQYINGIYYFLIHEHDGTWNSDTRYRYSRFDPKNPDSTDYCFGIFRGKGSLGGSTEIIPSDSGTLCLGNDSALSFHESNGVRRFNFEAEKIEYIIGKGASTYLLIGEYLYKQMYSGEWQKTNISNGWDNLQWEILQFPD